MWEVISERGLGDREGVVDRFRGERGSGGEVRVGVLRGAGWR